MIINKPWTSSGAVFLCRYQSIVDMVLHAGQKFIQSAQQAFTADSAGTQDAVVFFDANGDHYPDLYVVKGRY